MTIKDVERQGISNEVWEQNYRSPKDQSLDDTWERQARACSSVEDASVKEQVYEDFKWLLTDFKGIAGGRITANLGVEGREATTLYNCFVFNPGDVYYKDSDSIEGIYDMLKYQAHTLKSEGGYGMNFSWIRPNGSYVAGIDSRTPGVLNFMELWDTSSKIITMGSERVLGEKKPNEKKKIRKGAQMGILECTHPEIEDFIEAKQVEGRLSKFNISVGITKGFIEAVLADENWDLKFPDTECEEYKTQWFGNIHDWESKGLPVIVHKTIKARDLWSKITKSTYARNDPGVLFLDLSNKLNPLYYAENIATTNPCFSGDTLIAVADGRNYVSIKQLADEGKDVPVYSVDKISGDVSIKWGRHPRITGENQKLIRVHLDDNSYLDVTPNHKFILLDGSEKEAKDLEYGDSLPRFTKSKEPVKAGGKPYYRVYTNTNNSAKKIFEHRLIAKFYYEKEWDQLYDSLKNNGFAKTGGVVVHHKDYDQLNNSPENLQIMSFKDHSKLHGSIDQSGEKNGRHINISNDEIIEHARKLTIKLGRKVGITEWQSYASENSLPQSFSNFRKSKIGSVNQMLEKCAIQEGLAYEGADPRSQETCIQLLSQGYNAFIENNRTFIRKNCEICSSEIITPSYKREISVCMECVDNGIGSSVYYDKKADENKKLQAKIYSDLKFKFNKEPMKKEWEQECKNLGIPFRLKSARSFKSYKEVKEAGSLYNHKVVGISEIQGEHTVYNITVDDNHTVGIVTDVGKGKQTGVYVTQCGEINMSTGVCLLFSLNLVKYIKETNKSDRKYEFDFDEFKKAVKIATRFADNINDISRTPLPAYKKAIEEKRRLGIGVLSLGSLHYCLGIRFGSEESQKLIKDIFKAKAETEILTSAEIGKEKGSFKLFDKEKYFGSHWWKNLPISKTVKKAVEEIGEMRNSHRSANAPTGNMSIYAGVLSGGIEPVFMKEYARWAIVPEQERMRLREEGFEFPNIFGGEWFETKHLKATKAGTDDILIGKFNGIDYQVDKNRGLTKRTVVMDWGWAFVQANYTKEQIEEMEKAGVFVTTEDLSVDEHLKTLEIIAPFVDQNSSKTINVPNDYSYEQFENVYLDAWKLGIKGITTYRAGTMTAVLEAVDKPQKESVGKASAPKRPKELPCELHRPKIKGKEWAVIVGLYNGTPYEIFAGPIDDRDLPQKGFGQLVKKKKGQYSLIMPDMEIENIIDYLNDEDSAWATRMISMSLRHGIPLEFIYDQLSKDGNIVDVNKVLARILKKYINLSGKPKCPQCGSENLVLEEGCMRCLECNFGKCG